MREIVTAWLTEHGYDGLAGDQCGCLLGDLMLCGEPEAAQCVAGYLSPGCSPSCPVGDCEYHVVEERRAVVRADSLTEAERAAGRARRKEVPE